MAVAFAFTLVLLASQWREDRVAAANSAMFEAVENADVEGVRECLRRGVDMNVQDITGMTPLACASRTGRVAVVRELLEVGADPDIAAPVFGTAIVLAAFHERREIVGMLLRAGADPNTCDGTGASALWYAASNGDRQLLSMLMDAGADVSARARLNRNDGTTPVAAATTGGHAEIAKHLMHGARRTALHDAER